MTVGTRRTFLAAAAALTLIPPAPVSAEVVAQPMPKDNFWSIVDRTVKHQAYADRQIEALASELRALSAEDVVAFAIAFDEALDESYRWNLWGAAYVVHGGASDDGFDYFRSWLISKGRATFEAVLADPDSLAERSLALVDGIMEFERFAYVAGDIWAEKTGVDTSEMPRSMGKHLTSMPVGEEFDEDPDSLAKTYPKLWRKYGRRPLG